jgi:hypothetical protein
MHRPSIKSYEPLSDRRRKDMMNKATKQTIDLGYIVTSGKALARLSERDIGQALARHAAGDWGECDEEACQRNERALAVGDDLFSLYRSETGEMFCVLTVEGRSSTGIRMLDEYHSLIAELH